jgi:hypothetical protein
VLELFLALRGWVGEEEEEAIYSGLVDGAEEEIERIGGSPGGFLVETGGLER